MTPAAYCGSRISPHIVQDNAGFLICTAPIARSGWQEYRLSEILPGSYDDRIVRVYRPPSEVISAATIASGEGKPVVGVGHPAAFLTPESWAWAAKGHMQNIRVGPKDKDGNVTIIADLHIQDQALISQIQRGVRDLSCGYLYDVDEGPESGTLTMRNIRMNHCAVVREGRAKTTYIVDAEPEQDFAALARRYHRRNVSEMSTESARATDAATFASSHGNVYAKDEDMIDPEEVRDEKLNRLLHLLESLIERNAIAPSVRRAITARDGEGLRVEVDPGRAWEDAIRRAGAGMRGERVEARIEERGHRATDSEEDWAATANAAGRRMRQRKK